MVTYTSDFTQETYSARDFVRLLEHRVRKDWRIGNQFDKRKAYALIDDGKLTTNLLKQFIAEIFAGHFNLTLIKPGQDVPLTTHLLSSDCLDTYLARRLDVFLAQQDFGVFSELAPLRTLTKQECEQLAEIWQITGTPIPLEHAMIASLHGQYEQTKQSMLKSFLAITDVVNSSETK